MYNFQDQKFPTIDDVIIDQLVGLTESEVTERYDEYLDDIYGEIDCKFATYQASYLMEEMDPTMYRCGFSDYTSEYYREIDGLYYHEDDAQNIEDQCEECEDATDPE